MAQDRPPPLEYASPPLPRGNGSWQRSMHLWRSVTLWSLVPLLLGAAFAPLAIAGAVILLLGSVMTLLNMTRLAADEAGRGYALRHLLLAILLWPVLLLGVFLVPSLVECDVIRWREQEMNAKA